MSLLCIITFVLLQKGYGQLNGQESNSRFTKLNDTDVGLKITQMRDFPGSPEVKTPRFHWRGRGFNPWSGELRSHMPEGRGQKKKKKKITQMSL